MSELHEKIEEGYLGYIFEREDIQGVINLCMDKIIEEASENKLLDNPYTDYLATDRMIAIAESLKEQDNESR